LIVVTSKHYIMADLLIEDAAHTIKKWVESRRRAIMLETPYNTNIELTSAFTPWLLRASNWAEIVTHVERVGG